MVKKCLKERQEHSKTLVAGIIITVVFVPVNLLLFSTSGSVSSGGGAVLDSSFAASSADVAFFPKDAPSWTASAKPLCWFKLSGSSGLTSVRSVPRVTKNRQRKMLQSQS